MVILLTVATGMTGSLITSWAWQESGASNLIGEVVTRAVEHIPGAKGLVQRIFFEVDSANQQVQDNIDSPLFPDIIRPQEGASYPASTLLSQVAAVEFTEALLSLQPPISD